MDLLWIINVEFIAIVFRVFLSTFVVVYHVAMEIIAQNRTALCSGNELRNSATRHVAPCDTPCHTCEFNARVKVARKVARCDITLRAVRVGPVLVAYP